MVESRKDGFQPLQILDMGVSDCLWNTLAYHDRELITGYKSFMKPAPDSAGVDLIKLIWRKFNPTFL